MANGALIVWVKTISERLRQAMPGKRIQLDDETLEAVEALASRTGKSFQSLADEAFADLLAKHKQPVGLKAALEQSVSVQGKPSSNRKRR